MVQTSFDSSLSVPLGDLDDLKILQRSFVITYMDKCCNNFVFVCKKFYVSSVFSELNSLVGAYVVSNLAQSDIWKFHLSFNKADNFKGVKCGPLPFFVRFGSFIKTQLNLDLSMQPAPLLQLMFLSRCVLSSKLRFLQSMTFGFLNSKKQMFLVIVVGFSMTLQEWWR